ARSVGAEVDFEPKNKSDSRFGGLIGINDDEFDAIREGILDKLSVLIPLIATGASEDAIYAKWKEITAEDMAVADEYLASAHLSSAESTAIASAVGEVERPVSEPEVTDIFMTVETGEQPLVVASVESIDRQASQRYRVWLPSGVLSPEQINDLHPRLSNGEVHVLAPISFDGIANTNDLVQALLPVLFPDHERIVVVPAAAEISADIVELSNGEPGEARCQKEPFKWTHPDATDSQLIRRRPCRRSQLRLREPLRNERRLRPIRSTDRGPQPGGAAQKRHRRIDRGSAGRRRRQLCRC